MKKLSLLLTLMCIMLTSCENGGGIVEDNNGTISSPQIKLYNEFVEVGYEADIHSVSVTSTCSWEAKSINDWISLEDSNGIQGTSDLKFYIERNSKTESREGIIIIENVQYNIVTEFRVRQKAFEPNITVFTESLQYMPEGGSKTVVINSNIVYDISENTEWISCEKIPNGIIIDVENHDGINERHAEIVISNDEYNISKTLIISQSAFLPEITTDAESLDFPFQGGEQRLLIASNIEYDVITNSNWLQCEMHDGSLLISVQPNTKEEKRHTEIIVTNSKYDISKTININQHELIKSAANVLLYTSYDNQIIEPYQTANFGANIISNTYDNQGVIIFDADITAIGNSAFKNCSYLTSIIIPNRVTFIGAYAFEYCKQLKEVILGSGVTVIGDYAFRYCDNLVSLTIPDCVTKIGYAAFYQCSSLANIDIPDSITTIGDSAFSSCDSLTEIILPNSVTTLGDAAFYGCDNLTKVTLSNSLQEICQQTFEYCRNLREVIIGENVYSIGHRAFYECYSLTSISIPNNLLSVGSSAFHGCDKLTSVHISDLSAWCKINFANSSSNPTSNGAKLYLKGKELTSVVIPSDITEIKQYAFDNCSSVTNVTIGNSVTLIGECAFSGCPLTDVTIPNSVTEIGYGAFWHCNKLTSATISNSVTSIGRYAFSGCAKLTSFYCMPITPPYIGTDLFSQYLSTPCIYVPRNSVEAYKSAENWGYYTNYIVGYDFE